MFKSLRSRFILTHILPTLLVVPLASMVLLYLIETQFAVDNLKTEIDTHTVLLAEFADEVSASDADVETIATLVGLSRPLKWDGLLIGPNCQIFASSIQDETELEAIKIRLCPNGEFNDSFNFGLAAQTTEREVILEQTANYRAISQTLTATSQQIVELRRLFIYVILLELLIGLIIGAFLAGHMSQPITAVTTTVNEIANQENIHPVPEKGAVELKILAHSVNLLTERLRELEDSRRKLLANLVHELGRPLGAMLAAVHVLRQGADEDPDLRQELLKGVEDHIHVMQPLLDDLAQLGGQVLGTRELNMRPIALSEWLPPLLLPWRASAHEKGLTWQADVPANLPSVEIDPDRMAQALGNLLSNAIKYTARGGEISFTAVAQSDQICLIISDNGPGISAEEQGKIFDLFYRSSQQTRFPQGMGLGLTIARDLVEAHGGTLSVKSQLNEGSHFTIQLPINRLPITGY